jgi:hypothetical protein
MSETNIIDSPEKTEREIEIEELLRKYLPEDYIS